MSSQPTFIKCPKTGKPLSVSRDVYHALEYAKQKGEHDQRSLQDQFEGIMKTTSNKKYLATSCPLVKTNLKFDEKGKIDEFDFQIELAQEIEELDGRTKELVKNALYQFMMCINDALDKRSIDMKEKIESLHKQSA